MNELILKMRYIGNKETFTKYYDQAIKESDYYFEMFKYDLENFNRDSNNLSIIMPSNVIHSFIYYNEYQQKAKLMEYTISKSRIHWRYGEVNMEYDHLIFNKINIKRNKTYRYKFIGGCYRIIVTEMDNEEFNDIKNNLKVAGNIPSKEEGIHLFYVPEIRLYDTVQDLIDRGYEEVVNSDDESE